MSNDLSILTLIMNASVVVQGVLVLLLVLSVTSWAIIFNKWRLYSKTRREAEAFSSAFWGGKDMDTVLAGIPQRYPNSALPNIFQAGYREFMRNRRDASATASGDKITAGGGLEGIRRSLDAALSRELERMARNLAFLATVGSTSPFIGLFGTVWGIMNAFQNIALTKNTSLAAVAPGIAEALVATAFGLVAAIPAVVAYNKFTSDLKRMAASMEQFSSEFLNILSRHIKE
ncbi:MAG: protein TolQ [Zetaproteobacteria bacterium CG12_big_fil_rev_8_21_14_0_65_55_1124]|nr:MAG: protein TolQ [Zetaproteobacteria bacterium CG1_02_55_237]PIS19410.1 MAG: protein TolQ [Zetaproteobacteria bacterium CG08_land_8_20_14_0_20_55_17]PIW42980.1 MAG: protein TolQ [Zetaproteobacteria bacterium CG12_big_fil_rev_8_21_14_0_65_55_1124]PIY51522.1 MAG: protein TolQ [Zetaproteobacteria bacterium CG_4_10_14_0_8_um_filter_55_43]PIZ39208.1 MAG: protein TolQ [Zetaproteobacteria bacterium CG_4_10_14_0_2_um_filter_55_20]PJB80134.1 MAG: protein TolQ [Zetaproteobacteria bacterium CG_4_9_14